MPAIGFYCPDSIAVKFSDCMAGCRCGTRCLSKRTLRAVGEQREWKGEPSTTQLLKGTREAYLEITQEYFIRPDGELFRVLGSKAHAYLEEFTDNELTEERLRDNIASGQFDFYDPEDQALYDTKTWGSFKVARGLGIKIESKDVPTGEVYKTDCKSGKKGEPKTRKEYYRVQAEPDMRDTEIQLNHYRMMLEEAGFPVKQMFVEAVVRDGGTFTAKNRGVDQNGYLIPVKILPDQEVKDYLQEKATSLLWALESGEMPEPCNSDECWDGRKCKDYCRVAQFCDSAIKEEVINDASEESQQDKKTA